MSKTSVISVSDKKSCASYNAQLRLSIKIAICGRPMVVPTIIHAKQPICRMSNGHPHIIVFVNRLFLQLSLSVNLNFNQNRMGRPIGRPIHLYKHNSQIIGMFVGHPEIKCISNLTLSQSRLNVQLYFEFVFAMNFSPYTRKRLWIPSPIFPASSDAVTLKVNSLPLISVRRASAETFIPSGVAEM